MLSLKDVKLLQIERLRSGVCAWCIEEPNENCSNYGTLKCIFKLASVQKRLLEGQPVIARGVYENN